MKLEWFKVHGDRQYAESHVSGRYWIDFTGTQYRLEHVERDKIEGTWEPLGLYQKPSIAKGIATKRENKL